MGDDRRATRPLNDSPNHPTPRLRRVDLLARAALASLAATFALPAIARASGAPRIATLDTLLTARDWLNGTPTRDDLRGKVVLVDVFTFDCINCQNVTPNIRTLARAKHPDLAIDNDYALRHAYGIQYWPTQLLFDRRGTLRQTIIGDSQDAAVDAAVDALLREPA